MAHVFIVVPTRFEQDGICRFLDPLLEASGFLMPDTSALGGGARMYVHKHLTKESGLKVRVALLCSEAAGNVASAASTAYAIGRWGPELVISAGIAGSLHPSKAWIGDIILPVNVETLTINKVYASWDAVPDKERDRVLFLKSTSDHPVRIAQKEMELENSAYLGGIDTSDIAVRLAQAQVSYPRAQRQPDNLLASLADMYEEPVSPPEVPRCMKNSPTFSWEKVQDSYQLHKHLMEKKFIKTDPLCVEMESWGFAVMVKRLREMGAGFVPLVVRGISDIVGAKHLSDDKDAPNEGVFRTIALHHVAITLHQLVEKQLEAAAKAKLN